MVWEGLQPLETRKQCPGAARRIGGEFGASDIAHHQRVAGQHAPGLLGAGSVGDQQTEVLRRMSGGMQNIERHIAELDPLAMRQAAEGESGLGRGMQRVIRSCARGQLAASRSVIGMEWVSITRRIGVPATLAASR